MKRIAQTYTKGGSKIGINFKWFKLHRDEDSSTPDSGLKIMEVFSIDDSIDMILLHCSKCSKSYHRSDTICIQGRPKKCKYCETDLLIKCKKCYNSFKTFSGACNHFKLTCYKPPNNTCSFCDFRTRYPQGLRNHMRTRHSVIE